MNKVKILLSSVLVMSLLSCGLEKMASDYDKVVYQQSPTILEVHGGKIVVNLKGSFPERYFAKKATVEITPVIINENGDELKLKSIILQGEQATGGESTIFFESGGDFVYSDKIDYTNSMLNSILELRALATIEDDNKVLGPVTIAKGVIATSMRIENDEVVAFADHGYKEVETVSETATIYFLVNKSNIRTTEKSDDDVKKLQEFIKLGYKTESFVVKSSASPEGTEKINTELSDDRQNSTLNYAKYLLKKLRADGSSNDENYHLSSAGADWDGFNKLVESSTIAEKSTILSLSNRNKEKTQKERGELLQDMAEVYDALESDVLQYLRKSEITINSYLPKKTKEEIMNLAVIEGKYPKISVVGEDSIDINGNIVYGDYYSINPEISKLDVNEALYAASLIASLISEDLYPMNGVVWFETLMDTIGVIFEDWRAYNNLAAYNMESGKLFDIALAYEKLNKARELGGDQPEILINLGILASWNGDLNKAQKLFDQANTSNYNKATLNLRMGDYRSACRYYRGEETYNATLATILNGDNNSNCSEETSACYYLNAIAGARLANESMLFVNLEKAINSDSNYKIQATKDLEFLNYRENEKFISLTK